MHNEGGGLRPRILKAAAKGFGGDRKAPEIGRETYFDFNLALGVKQA